jgi:hypothetical protein
MAKEAKDTTLLPTPHLCRKQQPERNHISPKAGHSPCCAKRYKSVAAAISIATQPRQSSVRYEIEEKPKAGQHGVAVMMIGEQPGDKEDIEGRPFVGPAGKLLDQCLEEANIERSQVNGVLRSVGSSFVIVK